jgi:Spy/CpxP family protein refolding chaperone
MNNDKKTKSLITIIIFLLITNIAMLVFFVMQGKPAERRQRNHESNGMYNSLKNDVGFSDAQLDQYKQMREEQMKKVHPMFDEVRAAKKDFYGLMNSTQISDSLVNADADSIAQKQKHLDLQMFGYFKNVRAICTDAQKPKFDSLMKKVVMRMIGRPGQPHKK